jgi:hypothetical protein
VVSVAEIASNIRTALDAAGKARAHLLAALEPAERASASYARLGAGTTQPDLPAAASEARRSADTIRRALASVDKAADAARAWLASIAGPAVTPNQPARSTTAPTRPAWQLGPAEVERLRGELPPPIKAAERGTGLKTHGRWVGADGVVRPVVSGVDEWSRYVDTVFRRLGRRIFTIGPHAEMKVAARLRAEFERTGQPQHATIVLNNEPCALPKGCATLLPVMLPEGCALTVHAPNYRRTFTGGATL